MDQDGGVRFGVSLQKLIWGIVLVGLGVLFLLDNLDLFELGDLWRYWPLVLIALGIAKIVQPDDRKGRSSGAWLVMIGLWLLVGSLELFGLNFGSSWPLLLVGIGAVIVFQAIVERTPRAPEDPHGIR